MCLKKNHIYNDFSPKLNAQQHLTRQLWCTQIYCLSIICHVTAWMVRREQTEIDRKQRMIRGQVCCQCLKGRPVSARAHDTSEPCLHERAHAGGDSPAAIKVRCTHWFVPWRCAGDPQLWPAALHTSPQTGLWGTHGHRLLIDSHTLRNSVEQAGGCWYLSDSFSNYINTILNLTRQH